MLSGKAIRNFAEAFTRCILLKHPSDYRRFCLVDHQLAGCANIVAVALSLRQLGRPILESPPKPSLDILTLLNCIHCYFSPFYFNSKTVAS